MKNRPDKNSTPTSSNRESDAPDSSDNKVAARAYEIWESEGRAHGSDQDHWLRAEREFGPRDTSSSAGGARHQEEGDETDPQRRQAAPADENDPSSD